MEAPSTSPGAAARALSTAPQPVAPKRGERPARDRSITVPEPRPSRNTPDAALVPLRGSQTGTPIALERGRITLGRARDCDIVLDDATISRHHAELSHDQHDRYSLVDTGSLNGIYLNRHPLAQQTDLADGDEIWIGTARFTFRRRPPATPEEAEQRATTVTVTTTPENTHAGARPA